MGNNRKTGTEYEMAASEYLVANGYEIIERNYNCKYGEIDIIAKDKRDGYLSFVEVKYRTSRAFGMPYEAVNGKKQQRIIKSSKSYIYEHHLSQYSKYRYDVVSILGNDIQLIKNAFGGFF